MAASAIYILDQKGKLLISRNFRGDVPLSIAERFIQRLLEEEEEVNVKPVIEEDGVSFLYVKHNALYFLAVTNRNSNAAMVLLFLHKMIEVFNEYFKELEEESIRDNLLSSTNFWTR